MTLSVALLLPWVTGAVVAALDGRRRAVGWFAVAVLTATLALLGVLTAQVLTSGSRDVLTGGWPAGVGIVLHPDVLGVTFATLSVLVLLAATAHEVLAGVRERVFPGLVLLLAGGLTGLFLTGDVFNFYVFFELAMTASYALTTYGGGPRQLRAAMVFAAVNLLGSFIFLISVAGTYRVTGVLAMHQVAERMPGVDPNAAILVAAGFFIAFSVKLGLFPSTSGCRRSTRARGRRSRPSSAGPWRTSGPTGCCGSAPGCSPGSSGSRPPRWWCSARCHSCTARCWPWPAGTSRSRSPTPPSARSATSSWPWVSAVPWG